MKDTIQDGIIASLTTGAVHSATSPTDTTATIILALISGVIAPIVKTLVEKWTIKIKNRKNKVHHENDK